MVPNNKYQIKYSYIPSRHRACIDVAQLVCHGLPRYTQSMHTSCNYVKVGPSRKIFIVVRKGGKSLTVANSLLFYLTCLGFLTVSL